MSFSSFIKDAFCVFFSSVPSNTVSGTVSVGRGKGTLKRRRFLSYQYSCDLAGSLALRPSRVFELTVPMTGFFCGILRHTPPPPAPKPSKLPPRHRQCLCLTSGSSLCLRHPVSSSPRVPALFRLSSGAGFRNGPRL